MKTRKVHFTGIAKYISGQLRQTRESLDIAVAWFTNEDLFTEVCNLSKEGVRVRLLIINDPINNRQDGLNFQRLIDAGGELFFGGSESLMHHKFCLIDNRILINGSYNWTYFAEYRNLENIQTSDEVDICRAFNTEFDRIVKNLNPVKDYKALPNQISESVEAIPVISDDLYYKSYRYESIGDYQKAIISAKRSMEYRPRNKALVERQVESLQSKVEEPSQVYYRPSVVVTNDRNEKEFKENLKKGVKLYRKRDYENAIESFRSALAINGDYGELYFWIGLCFWKLKQKKEVEDNCAHAIRLNPRYSLALNLYGIVKFENNRYEEAIEYFTKAHKFGLGRIKYKSLWNRGNSYKMLKKKSESEEDFKEVIRLINVLIQKSPDDEEAISIRGDANKALGRDDIATSDYRKAKKIHDAKPESEKDLNLADRINTGLKT